MQDNIAGSCTELHHQTRVFGIFKDKPTRIAPVLFLDLDGTVRRNKSGASFINSIDDIEIMPGIEDRIKSYKDKGFIIIGISNQAGIAHGFKTVLDVEAEIARTLDLLFPFCFDAIFYCPFDAKGKVAPYNKSSIARKPGSGMLAYAEFFLMQHEILIDWEVSAMVGDREEDALCAAGVDLCFFDIEKFLSKE